MRNYFILDGVDSRDFGVFISGQGTFNASGRDYNIIPVPGRNGDLVGPEKRFANGTLTYPAFIYSNFKQNIEDFRNFLLSLVGYHDLVDSYHPDQIRKVLFQGPFNADVQTKNDAGRFDIEFICKPQRFLASGNEVTTFESTESTETFSGSVITFENPDEAVVNALSTAINPVQSGSGDPSPTNVRPISGFSAANIVVSPTTTAGDGTTYTVQFGTAGTVYGGTLDVLTGVLTVTWESTTINDEKWSYNSSSGHFASSNSSPLQSKRKPGRTNLKSSAYLTSNASSSTLAPDYSIRGNSGVAQIYVKDTRFTDVPSWTAEMGNTQIIYELAEPQTYQLTPTEVQLLTGTNNIWSDTGDVTATIVFSQDHFTITNPTLFDSQPLMRVYGEGILGINSQSVTITQADEYTDIDCEMMDCYKGTTNKNPYVQFTDYNFPALKPGVNYVSLSGITKVEITPRWWIV